ncbi:succinylglutamate-semialdehyde dehydrogenase [Larsenimonas rhizosphaerae]|uniref:succinylglutamate-semialdehyde dehydrogenase n=1 Tax=Larsenimonas rhizosphaerae TaxID=2944682 RepID=UPI002033214C|nr:succinylglutamate-semialdehyde dehydrogenase [Larsenimonas rhizosphaerae]MCM2129934.1 succinylglutamate-semialdehyde dehydrogenase [Larsenimonas rhizosphaerae]
MTVRQQLWIDGQWRSGEGENIAKHDPVDGRLVWRGDSATEAQVDEAITAARRAFPEWARRALSERLAIIERFRSSLERHHETLATLIARETGKPYWESLTEVSAMIAKIEVSRQSQEARAGEQQRQNGAMREVVRHRPHGVMAVFGPYNFPGHLPNGHIVPALLAGNTVVFKPSELTPATADLVMQCWEAAGLPAGVINLVQGGADTGRALSQHQGVDGLLFTGSARTGALLHAQSAGQMSKVLALELGGNNPLIVGELEALEPAVLAIIQSAYVSGGQRCTCARRLLVPRTAQGDALIELLINTLKTLRVAEPFSEPSPFYSGLVSSQAAHGLLEAQAVLQAAGGQVLVRLALLEKGSSLLSPGLVDVTGCSVPDEEYFGPLLQVRRYETMDEAIELANQTRYGLAAGLIGGTASDWDNVLLQVRAGIINWNRPTTGASSKAPFGGVGDSGNHAPSAWYAADYCAYPVASMESDQPVWPDSLPPGLEIE